MASSLSLIAVTVAVVQLSTGARATTNGIVTNTPDGCESFEAWATLYSRSYPTRVSFARTQATFTANCERYSALNAVVGGAKYFADAHADMTPSEFSEKMGACYSEPQQTKSQAVKTTSSNVSKSVDWRTKGQVTPVKNQGAFGTCWSFGVAENLEGLNVRQGHALTNISEQEFISCCHSCQGASADHSFEWLMNATDGQPALEASWPYVGSPGDCKLDTAPKAPVKLASWSRVSDDGTGTPIVDALMERGPMGMGVDATCFHGYHSGVIRNCTSKGIDHAVLMVAAGVDTGVNYFTIKNSWSATWGEHGYVRIEQGHEWWGPISTIYTE
eukprot:m.35629 g.35629  ORF g.35629 m.35629 type:complete len:330 (-) comp17174_c1_seq1:148-1137(-)